jgi:hypothetical protein
MLIARMLGNAGQPSPTEALVEEKALNQAPWRPIRKPTAALCASVACARGPARAPAQENTEAQEMRFSIAAVPMTLGFQLPVGSAFAEQAKREPAP